MTDTQATPPTTETSGGTDGEVLVVASKLKNFIRATSGGFNTSGAVPAKLSEIIRHLCTQAIENAKKDGRKTVMDRDFDVTSIA